jgi:choline-glycine betaine transporter
MSKSFWQSSNGIAAIVMIAAVSYFLFMEHRQHVFQALPFLIILLCPLMHIFMHGGHGDHHHHDNDDEEYRRGLEDGRRQAREDNYDNKRS